MKALAFGSKRPHIPECFKAVASSLLDRIFEAAEEAKQYDEAVKSLIGKCFDLCNAPEVILELNPSGGLDYLKRSVFLQHSGKNPYLKGDSSLF